MLIQRPRAINRRSERQPPLEASVPATLVHSDCGLKTAAVRNARSTLERVVRFAKRAVEIHRSRASVDQRSAEGVAMKRFVLFCAGCCYR